MTAVSDVVLLYLEDTPVSFARVESILPDAKKDWYHIKLLMLQIPVQTVTWILKDAYINGQEFNMNGKKMRLEKVERPEEDPPVSEAPAPPPSSSREKGNTPAHQASKIISFSDFKKKNHDPESG